MARIYPATEASRAVVPADSAFTLQEIETLLRGSIWLRVQRGGIFAYRMNGSKLGLAKNERQRGFPGEAWGDVLALHWGELGFDLDALDPGRVIRDGDAGSLHWTEADVEPESEHKKGRELC
jgi:hypothetical protein